MKSILTQCRYVIYRCTIFNANLSITNLIVQTRIEIFFLMLLFCLPFSIQAQSICAAGESSVELYTSYGINYRANNRVSDAEFALGDYDNRYAALEDGSQWRSRGRLDVELTDNVQVGDTIWFHGSASNGIGVLVVRTSANGWGFRRPSLVLLSTASPNPNLYYYVVRANSGARFIRFSSYDTNSEIRIWSVYYNRKECVDYCPGTPINYTTGNAVSFTASSTGQNMNNGLAAPDDNGAVIDGGSNQFINYDFGTIVPYGAYVQIHLADDGSAANVRLSGSLDNTAYSNVVIASTLQEEDVFTPYLYKVNQKSGIRYLKLQLTSPGEVAHIDALEFKKPEIFGKNTISGIAFEDGNINGIRNFGEVGVAGINLDLYSDNNGNGILDVTDNLEQSTTTIADGVYNFNITSQYANYFVRLDQLTLPGGVSVTTDVIQMISFNDLNEYGCVDFGYYPCSTGCIPIAFDDEAKTNMNVPISVSVLNNDLGSINIASLSTTGVLQASNGTTLIVGSNIVYTPNINFTGTDQFEYIICNAGGSPVCDTALVIVDVSCFEIPGQKTIYGSIFRDFDIDGVFDAGEQWPFPEPMSARLYNDINANHILDGFDVFLSSVNTDINGNYQFNLALTSVNYIVAIDETTGPAGSAITTPFYYPVNFTGAAFANCGNDFGITFCSPNCPVMAIDDIGEVGSGAAVFLDVTDNDQDYDNNIDISSLQITVKPHNGSVVIGDNGVIIYVPNGDYMGVDSFSYQICDANVPVPFCDEATVFITVNPGFGDPCFEASIEHIFYLPYPEEELRTALINSSGTTCNTSIGSIARSVTTIKSPYPGVVIKYDHWEDGYENDILVPTQSTTLIWGDRNPDNGVAPGYFDDFIPAGGNIILDNNMIYNPRNPAIIAFDGKDKMYTTRDIALSKVSGSLNRFSIQAAKTDVYDINRFGTSFTIPFGEDLGDEFQYASLFIRAALNNTKVNVDVNNDGRIDTTTVLNEGEVLFIDGNVISGAKVTATDPVGVDALFGGLDCFGTRQVTLLPASFYSYTYYAPVPTTKSGDVSAVYLNNSLKNSIDINWTSSLNSGVFTIPGNSSYKFILNDNSGYRFTNLLGKAFTAIGVMDAGSSGSTYDWSYNLISKTRLTDFASIAWAPGSIDGTGNYNPIWVTPTSSTTIYVKYDGDVTTPTAQTSPCGMPYDVTYNMRELEYMRIFDNSDNDQSGIAIYTCDGTPIAAVYGEDPAAGGPTPTASPALDVGTSIQPMCLNQLILANDDIAVVQPDDYVVIPVTDNDYGFLTTLDLNSITFSGLQQSTNGTVELNDDATINYIPDLGFSGLDTFQYSICSVESPGLCDVATVFVTVTDCNASSEENLINGFVYLEQLIDDGEYDNESRSPGFLVRLIGDSDCDGEIDNDELIIETVVSDASGAYSFSTINGEFVKDEFDDSTTLNGGNFGSLPWDNDWQEVGESNGFDNANVIVTEDLGFNTNVLRLAGTNRGASRNCTFNGATEASLKFDYRRQSLENNGEAVIVQFNGITIFVIDDGNGVGTNPFYIPVDMEIPYALINPNGSNTIRFLTNSSVQSSDYFLIDNVEVIFNKDQVCFITQVDVSDKNSAYFLAELNQGTATFATTLGNCVSNLYLGVLANIIAYDDLSSGEIDNKQTISVLDNDIGNPDLASLSTNGLVQPSFGITIVNPDGTIEYTPNPGYEGVDSFEYRICSIEDPAVCDTATVFVSISCLVVVDSNVIAGSIFNDINSNGVFDVGEGLYPGLTVNLYEDENDNGILDGTEGDTPVATTTSATGNYSFVLEPLSSGPVSISRTVSLRVDDANEERDGDMSLNSSTLYFSYSRPYTGMRFQDIQIPEGATIQSATIRFRAASNDYSNSNLTISAEAADNPNGFSNDDDNISDRYDSGNTVSWNGVANFNYNWTYYTPDISLILQNLVNRTGWESGNNMAIIVRRSTGTRRVRSRNYSSSRAPRLDITYVEESYPINYIAQIDTSSLPNGGSVTTGINQPLTFSFADESSCNHNFGVNRNTTHAVNDISEIFKGKEAKGNVLTNDFDLEGDDNIFESFLNQDGGGQPITSGSYVNGDEKGRRTANAARIFFDNDGNFTLVPDSTFVGSVRVAYRKCDGGAKSVCATANLTINVRDVTNPYRPTSNGVFAVDDYNTSYGQLVKGNILLNDDDPEGDNINLQGYNYDNNGDGTPNASGTIGNGVTIGGIDQFGNPTINAGNIQIFNDGYYQFIPTIGFIGKASLNYRICDDFAVSIACDTADIVIDVLQSGIAGNNPPFAGDDFSSTMVNVPSIGDWIHNDGDNDLDLITFNNSPIQIDPYNTGLGAELTTLATKQGGSVIFYDDGTYKYTPPFNFSGGDQIRYRICDVVAVPLCDSATLYLATAPVYFDFGDLAADYTEAAHLISFDAEGDGKPDLSEAYWLGQIIDAELVSKFSKFADGDNGDNLDDEDGVIFPDDISAGQDCEFKVIVGGNQPGAIIHFGLWIDWDDDGTFDDFFNGDGNIGNRMSGGRRAAPDTISVIVPVPVTAISAIVNVRARASLSPLGVGSLGGVMRSGEVEDYYWDAASLLPVEFASFTAEAVDNEEVLLKWVTASEINNDYFTIERSVDAINWDEIEIVNGAGNSSVISSYFSVDYNPYSGVSYYRLRQTDFDGTFDYSKIESVEIMGSLQVEANVYPNPTKGLSNVRFKVGQQYIDKEIDIKVVSLIGQIMYDRNYIMEGNSTIQLDLNHLRPGSYMIVISVGESIIYEGEVVISK